MALPLVELLNENYVDLDLRTRTLQTAQRKLIKLLARDGQIREPEEFLAQVLARERTNPSAVEHGVAFPHARTDLVDKIVLAAGRSRAGIPFVKEGARAHLIFLIGVPQRLVNDYLISVGALARLVKDDEVRQRLLHAETPREFIEILKSGDQNPFA
jgi:mannitol/fructose-specific phosphotransferase system IIA component (Ntr-type)